MIASDYNTCNDLQLKVTLGYRQCHISLVHVDFLPETGKVGYTLSLFSHKIA